MHTHNNQGAGRTTSQTHLVDDQSKKRHQGQGLVEFALILPLLLLLVLGIVEFSYIFITYTSMFNAAREGTRYGVVHPKDTAEIIARTREKIMLTDPAAANITLVYDSGPGTASFTDTAAVEVGDRVSVTLAYDLPTITPVIQPIVSSLYVETGSARTIVSLGEVASLPPGGGGGGEGGGGGGGGDEGEEETKMPDIEIDVTANPMTAYSGEEVEFTYTITNTGDLALTDVTIEDSFGNVIEIGELLTGTVTVRTVTQVINTTTTNLAGVSAIASNGSLVIDSDSATVTIIGPALDLRLNAEPEVIASGQEVLFRYTVENTGDTALSGVDVEDILGTPISPVELAPGEAVFWEVSQAFYTSTINFVSASGTDALSNTVSDSESITIYVRSELTPIVIHEPLYEGSTVVTGTAEGTQNLYIRDLMSDTFPSPAGESTTVAADGTFQFTGLPPLQAGHIIVVEGYGSYDSALVQGLGPFEPITITTPLCHGDMQVTGQADPDQEVTLVITGTSYEAVGTVDANGYFTFTMPDEQPLQAGHEIRVSGYGESDSAMIESCETDAYITISPQCGPAGAMTITVKGYNWDFQNKNDDVTIKWDDAQEYTYGASKEPPDPWSQDIIVDVVEGTHQISAINGKTPVVTATFLSPCPAPNLVITDLSLITPTTTITDTESPTETETITTTTIISTHQPLDFSVTVANTGSLPVNNLFWVDLYAAEPTTQSMAWGAVSSLGGNASTTITITLDSGFEVTGTYHLWAMVDPGDRVDELDETDNESGIISVTVSAEGTEPTEPVTGTATIQGETWVSLTGIPVPHGRASVWCRDLDGNLVASTTSDDNAQYTLPDLPAGTYTITGEAWIDGKRYSNTYEITVADGETSTLFIIMYED